MTSLNETVLVERYLDRRLTRLEYASFSMRLAVDALFRAKVGNQSTVRKLIKLHHAQKTKDLLHAMHLRRCNDPDGTAIQDALKALFKK